MSFKKASVFTLSFFILLGGAGIYFATKFKTMATQAFLSGPKFYPILLCSLLVLFSAIAMIDDLRKEDKKVEIPNIKRFFIVLLIIALWLFLWIKLIGFYPSSMICIALMLLYLNPKKGFKNKIKETLIADIIIVGLIYFVFTVLLKAQII